MKIEKEFIPYEQSLALKELGFDEDCFGYYVNAELDLTWKFSDCSLYQDTHISILAPLYQQAFRWLWNKTGKYIIPIQKDDKEWLAIGIVYKTYEEAELECLKKLIEIIKKK